MDSDKKVQQGAIPTGDALYSDNPREARQLASQERQIEYNRHAAGEVQRVRCGGGCRILRKRIGGD
jgi:hypothetical protein